jgi:hypothetical protein
MRPRPALSMTIVAAMLALILGACSDGDDSADKAETAPPPAQAPRDDDSGTPPASPGQLPPAFVQCMAEQGFEIQSSGDIHSAPPQVVQACFGALHRGGG